MRASQAEKDKSHARILDSASRLIRSNGIEGASVAHVMRAAKLTHGGFYKHFDSKDALVESALDAAFAEFERALTRGHPDTAFAAYRNLYLSSDHMRNPGKGCPAAALGPEVARSSANLRAAFGRGVGRIVDAIARTMRGSVSARQEAAMREFSMMVGAVVIARASDPALAAQFFSACRGVDRYAN